MKHQHKRIKPMLKKYTEEIPVQTPKTKEGPSLKTLNMILNYSRSLEVAQVKKEKMLVHLN
jgi:hypothetical protein